MQRLDCEFTYQYSVSKRTFRLLSFRLKTLILKIRASKLPRIPIDMGLFSKGWGLAKDGHLFSRVWAPIPPSPISQGKGSSTGMEDGWIGPSFCSPPPSYWCGRKGRLLPQNRDGILSGWRFARSQVSQWPTPFKQCWRKSVEEPNLCSLPHAWEANSCHFHRELWRYEAG